MIYGKATVDSRILAQKCVRSYSMHIYMIFYVYIHSDNDNDHDNSDNDNDNIDEVGDGKINPFS